MMKNSGGRGLAALMCLSGIAAMILRRTLYAVAVDEKGLLLRNHPLQIALAVLTGLVLLILLISAWRQKRNSQDSVTAGFPAAFGNVAAGAGILVTVLAGNAPMGGYLESAWRILGLAAPVCLFLAAVAVVLDKRPFFLLHVAACLFFLVHIVTRYQLWSSDPQMQDYVFALLAAIALMLFGYYTAAQEADTGDRPKKQAAGLAAVYLCLAELARSSCPGLYLGGAVWVLMDLCSARNRSADEKK